MDGPDDPCKGMHVSTEEHGTCVRCGVRIHAGFNERIELLELKVKAILKHYPGIIEEEGPFDGR